MKRLTWIASWVLAAAGAVLVLVQPSAWWIGFALTLPVVAMVALRYDDKGDAAAANLPVDGP